MFCTLTAFLFTLHVAFAAITRPLTSGGDAVQQNAASTWCYYPKADRNPQTICRGAAATFQSVVDAHINQTISISYYNAALVRVGGADGRTGDGSYETSCELSKRDNVIHALSRCVIAVGQREVTDGCYEPGLAVTNPTGTARAVPSGAITTGAPVTTAGSSVSSNARVLSIGFFGVPLVVALNAFAAFTP